MSIRSRIYSLEKDQIIILILLFLFVFNTLNNILIYREDNLVFTFHEVRSFHSTVMAYRNPTNLTHHIRNTSPFLYFYVTAIFFFLFGISLPVALITNHILLLIFIFYNYKLGKFFFNRNIAVISTFIMTTVPFFFGFSRFYDYKFAGVSLLPLVVYYMFKTEGFSNMKYTMIFTFSFIISVYFRNAIVNFLLPLLFIYIIQHRDEILDNFDKVFIMFFFFIISGLITIRIYPSSGIAQQVMVESVSFQEIGTIGAFLRNILSMDGFTRSVGSFFHHLRPFFVYIFSFSFIFYLYRMAKDRCSRDIILIVWISIPFMVYSFVYSHQHTSNLLPIFIPLSYITSYVVYEFSKKLERSFNLNKFIFISFFIFVLMTNFLMISYGIYDYPPKMNPEFIHALDHEFRYSPRQTNYKSIFKNINELDNPNIGILTQEKEPKKIRTYLWPFSFFERPLIENIEIYQYAEILPDKTDIFIGFCEDIDLKEIKKKTNIMLIVYPVNDLKEPDDICLSIIEELENDWTKIEEIKFLDRSTFDNRKLLVYKG